MKDRYFYLIGGQAGTKLKSVLRFDLKFNQWQEMSQLKFARQGHSSCYLGDYIYVCCGEGESGLLNSVERLRILQDHPSNQASQIWQLVPQQNFPSNFHPRQWLLTSPINDSEILIMGGHDGSWRNDGFILNVETQKCEKVA